MNKILIYSGFVVFAFLISFGIDLSISKIGSAMTGYSVLEESEESSIQEDSQIISVESCSDSDDGKNYYEKGSVEYCTDENCRSEEDSCSKGKLNEWSCSENNLVLDVLRCEVGYACYKGECILGSSSSGSEEESSTTIVANAETYNVYELGDLSFSRIELAKNERVNFNVLGAGHSIILNDIEPTQANIGLDGQSSTFGIGEEKTFDLNSDGNNETSVKLNSVNILTNKARISLTKI